MLTAARFLSRSVSRRAATLTAVAAAAVVLSACGSGSRVSYFVPTKMVSFGDENSLIDTYEDSAFVQADGTTAGKLQGLVYTVNTLVAGPENAVNYVVCNESSIASTYTACTTANGGTAGTLAATTYTGQWFQATDIGSHVIEVRHDTTSTQNQRMDLRYAWSCSSNTIWTQVVAHAYKLGYATYKGTAGQCPTDSYSNAYTYAAYGAKVADVVNQITAHGGELGKGTLATVMAGQWDIYEQYQAVLAGKSQGDAEAELKARAVQLADAIVAMTNTGTKVVVALTPDLGESPLAYNAGKTALLKALTTAFNDTLYIENLARRVTQGGRVLAGVNATLLTNTGTRSTAYVYAPNVVCPAADTYDASTSSGSNLFDPIGQRVTSSYITAKLGGDTFKAVKFCNTLNTSLTSTAGTYMWADQIHVSALGHTLIGSTAYSRANNQF